MAQQQIFETVEKQVEVTESALAFGKPLKRSEDPRLITGQGKYVDDLRLPNLLNAIVVRSPYAHAAIRKIDTSEALRAPGVKLVITHSDLLENVVLHTLPMPDGRKIPRPVLASREACFFGEAVAFVVADTKDHALDAAELVKVDYEPLEAAVDMEKAMEKGSPIAQSSLQSNVALVDRLSFGDVDLAFKRAFKTAKVKHLNQRLAPAPLEPRACLADYSSASGFLNFWISTQSPFSVRSAISNILQIPENKIRVIGPEVGGGFGAKLATYPEDLLVCIASMKLGQPVKWIESRTENFQTMTHGRGQIQNIELAADENGKILGLRAKLIGDAGAYLTGDSSDVTFTIRMISGSYVIPAYEGEATVVFTNKVLHDSYRGAARPEATFGIERAIDELAKVMGMDPAEIRLINFVPKGAYPYDIRTGFSYDSGDYAMTLQKALDLSDYEKWREVQRQARKDGRLIGIGLVSYVEICGFDPDSPQTASMTVSQTGKVMITTGTFPHGQGHETPFAQIVADVIGAPRDSISVSYGDTSQLAWGTFTAGSRSASLGGTAVLMCANKIRDKMALIAAHNLGTSADDLIFEPEVVRSKTNPEKRLSFQEVASLSYKPAKLPEGVESVLFAFSAFAPKNFTFPFGTHVVVAEIDRDTGTPKILEYTCVDDCGKVINPMIVEGQIHGGIVQGLGQAMLEGILHDNNGQLITSSFLDYQIPLAEDIPLFHNYRTVTASPSNPLGIKGIGEAGAIASTAAIANAVCDALSSVGATASEMPFTPGYLFELIKKAK
ncbi:MAG TPA: xanthine dehydrogenase family protein molybdopterin-binding subunit [Nitrososphaerales archaeon]|nr:xanthine dehydrogenase family protein molybdopterin-binding subunit [Nitrososphaerales archaeon]